MTVDPPFGWTARASPGEAAKVGAGDSVPVQPPGGGSRTLGNPASRPLVGMVQDCADVHAPCLKRWTSIDDVNGSNGLLSNVGPSLVKARLNQCKMTVFSDALKELDAAASGVRDELFQVELSVQLPLPGVRNSYLRRSTVPACKLQGCRMLCITPSPPKAPRS